MSVAPLDERDDLLIFKQMAEESPQMIIFFHEGRIIYANKKTERISGRKKSELYSKNFELNQLAIPEHRHLIGSLKEIRTSKNHKPETIMLTAISKKGKLTPLIVETHIMKYEGKTAIVGFGTDVTILKEKEDELFKINERYQAIMDAYPDGVLVTDKKGKLIEVNKAFATQTGYAKDEIIGKNVTRMPILLKRDIPKYLKQLTTILSGKILKPYEVTWKSKKGENRISLINIKTLLKNGKIQGACLVTKEITEQKAAEKEVQAKITELEQFQHLAVNREMKMIELKKRISKLEKNQ